jgi:hypothetical protein
LECINLKKEASDKGLNLKQYVYKEKGNCSKAKNEVWNKTCLKINCELGFKTSREEWTILKKWDNKPVIKPGQT